MKTFRMRKSLLKADFRQSLVILGLILIGGLLSWTWLGKEGLIPNDRPDETVLMLGIPLIVIYLVLRFAVALKPNWFR
ncbi:MAG: hypothetical protein HY507_01800 [Candidatus Zambryskibacteria bacterium]|nr:hypothetical protein [Candidatus Zambryskibacteria bacterium]